MKSKYGLLSIAFAAASVLCSPTDASADGGGWWGRGGYGLKVKDLTACIDDRDLVMYVAFKIPGAAAHYRYDTFAVSAGLYGAAFCDDHAGYDGWYSGYGPGPIGYGPGPIGYGAGPIGYGAGQYAGQYGGGFFGYGPAGYGPGLVGGYGPGHCGDYCDDLVILDGVCTDVAPAFRDHGNWFVTALDLLPLEAEVCHRGYLEDLYVDNAEIFIDGRSYFLDRHDIGFCNDGWDGWYGGYGWD
jgi:hypothetical protein